MIAHRHRGHAFADGFDDRPAFVTEDRRENAFRVGAREGVGIGMADTGSHHTQQHFTGLGHGDIDFNDLEGFLGLEGNSSARLDHGDSPANKTRQEV
jgi:hypothetical protein